MSNLLLVSTILITLALVFYSIGIWSEHFSKYLKAWHVAAFWLGFMFDVSGTLAMTRLANYSFNLLELHTLRSCVLHTPLYYIHLPKIYTLG